MKSKTTIIITIILFIIGLGCTWFATYHIMEDKMTIAEQEFVGTYSIENKKTTGLDNQYLYLYSEDDSDMPKSYGIYDADNTDRKEGNCKCSEQNVVTLYDGEEIQGTLLYGAEKFYWIQNGKEAVVLEKISDAAIIP